MVATRSAPARLNVPRDENRIIAVVTGANRCVRSSSPFFPDFPGSEYLLIGQWVRTGDMPRDTAMFILSPRPSPPRLDTHSGHAGAEPTSPPSRRATRYKIAALASAGSDARAGVSDKVQC